MTTTAYRHNKQALQYRIRFCEGGKTCEGNAEENVLCNQQECPQWADWTPWSTCSDSCGEGGTKLRTRLLLSIIIHALAKMGVPHNLKVFLKEWEKQPFTTMRNKSRKGINQGSSCLH